MIYGVNAFSSASFWGRYRVQRSSRAVYGRQVLHMLQFWRVCTIQSVQCSDKRRKRKRRERQNERTEEEAVKMDKKTKHNAGDCHTCSGIFKNADASLRAWATISLPSFFLISSLLFFISLFSLGTSSMSMSTTTATAVATTTTTTMATNSPHTEPRQWKCKQTLPELTSPAAQAKGIEEQADVMKRREEASYGTRERANFFL